MSTSPPASRGNRRLTSRYTCHLSVAYRDGSSWHPTLAVNLSAEGCSLRVGEDLPRGRQIVVRFEMPARNGEAAAHAEATGRVVWCLRQGLSYQAGVHFGESPDLARLVSALR